MSVRRMRAVRGSSEAGPIARRGAWRVALPEQGIRPNGKILDTLTERFAFGRQWGFARKLSRSKGVNALFHGHSGDGKTVPAEVIAPSPLDFNSNSHLGQSPEFIFSPATRSHGEVSS
jgi:hypothetical protein